MLRRHYRSTSWFGVSAIALAGAAEAAETIGYRYDSLGRLVRVERTGTVNSGLNTNYGYDCADNRAKVKSGPGVPPSPPPPSAPAPVPATPSPQAPPAAPACP